MAVDEELVLTSKRLRLREFRADDLDAMLAIVGDDRVTRSLAFDSMSRDQTGDMVRTILDFAADRPRTEYYLAVTLLEDDELIGFTRLGLGGVRAAKLGYAIAAGHWGHGYAAEAATIVLDLAFGPLGLHRVTAAIGPDNAGSIAVVRRLGFVPEGRLREHVFTNGAWRDSLLYSVLAPEWSAKG